MNKNWKNTAFTLLELIISILISSIILILIMSFISKIFNEISYSNKKTHAIMNIYNIESKLKNINWFYLSWSILIDNNWWAWSDVLLLNNNSWWYIFWQVDKNTLQIDSSTWVNIIWEKLFWYKKISSDQLTTLQSDSWAVYDYIFNLDELITDLYLKDLQLKTYNTWSIFTLELDINLNYKNSLNWNLYSDIWNKNIEKIILNF